MGQRRRSSVNQGSGVLSGLKRYLVTFRTPDGVRMPSMVKKAIRYGNTIEEAKGKLHPRNTILSIVRVSNLRGRAFAKRSIE